MTKFKKLVKTATKELGPMDLEKQWLKTGEDTLTMDTMVKFAFHELDDKETQAVWNFVSQRETINIDYLEAIKTLKEQHGFSSSNEFMTCIKKGQHDLDKKLGAVMKKQIEKFRQKDK